MPPSPSPALVNTLDQPRADTNLETMTGQRWQA